MEQEHKKKHRGKLEWFLYIVIFLILFGVVSHSLHLLLVICKVL